ncbi:MAG: NADPH-dependent F420 reductase [Bauldia sp.]|nr:NADPH-dependent F420 reductase [Bauldia sp.]
MSVAIIGAGAMGKALARRIAAAGESVLLTGRDPAKIAEIAGDIPGNVKAGPISSVVDSDVVILAVPYPAAADALTDAGPLTGKVLVDISNPVGPDRSLAIGMTTSAGEEVQKLVPQARVVKAFNTIFAELLGLKLSEPDTPPQVMFAGDHEFANHKVEALIRAIGFEPLDAGPLKNARFMEPVGLMMIQLGYGLGRGPRIAPRFVEY